MKDPIFDCPACLANLRSPRCKRQDCADAAAELRRLRQVAIDLRSQFNNGAEVFEAAAYLARAESAERRADDLGTRVALAERALRRLLERQPATVEVEAWKQIVKEQDAA